MFEIEVWNTLSLALGQRLKQQVVEEIQDGRHRAISFENQLWNNEQKNNNQYLKLKLKIFRARSTKHTMVATLGTPCKRVAE